MPSLHAFIDSIIQEQDKMIHMGALRSSPNQALLVGETRNVKARRNQKGKEKMNIEFEPK